MKSASESEYDENISEISRKLLGIDASLKCVKDRELEKAISEIIIRLIGIEKAAKIVIVLCENFLPLGCVFSDPYKKRSAIVISTDAKMMFDNDERRDIMNATLAHEIGHVMVMEATDYHFEKKDDFRVKAEIDADKEALTLLGKIYDKPQEVLLKQVNRAFNNMLTSKTPSQEQMDLARAFYEGRKGAILNNA